MMIMMMTMIMIMMMMMMIIMMMITIMILMTMYGNLLTRVMRTGIPTSSYGHVDALCELNLGKVKVKFGRFF